MPTAEFTRLFFFLQIFESECESGLKSGLAESSLLMENTFVPELTDGREEGKFLALDLGGTNFRVMLLVLQEGKIVKEEVNSYLGVRSTTKRVCKLATFLVQVSYYSVAEATRLGPGEELFDFLAECIYDFVVKQGVLEVRMAALRINKRTLSLINL